MMQRIVCSALFIISYCFTLGQVSPTKPELSNRVNILMGLNQPLLGGFNIEANLFYQRLAFDYSHGISLNLSNNALVGAVAEQGLAVHIPYTTGFGIGYRFNEWFNVRVEPKWHGFELYYEGDKQTADNLITSYNTFSLGLGAYANLRPFKRKDNFLKGIMLAPSIRWWPTLSSSLEEDQLTYTNQNTGTQATHDALEIGVANTPWIINVSLGYSVAF